MPSELHTERRTGTLVLTISDPTSREALSEQVFSAGVEALNVAESDDSVRCIVLQGDGANFCACGELPQPPDHAFGASADGQRGLLQRFHDFADALRVFPKPVIAAVEGRAASAGFSLVLACDLVVAAEDACFTMANGHAGPAGMGVTGWQLVHRLPRALALQLLWLPEPLSARQLHTWGLVNWVAAPGQALMRALGVADALAQTSSDAIASLKEEVNQWPQFSLPVSLNSRPGDLF